MFGRKKPLVELIAREDQALWLQSEEPLTGVVKVEAHIGSETATLTINILAHGTSYDTLNELIQRLGYGVRAHLYLAQLRQPLSLWPHLEVLLETKPEPANKRAHGREPFRLRVISSSLPGYQGVANNFSEQGAEIECPGPLEVGTPIELTLEPDRGSVRSLKVQAVVRRCQGGNKKYWLGVEFVEVSRTGQAQLNEILHQVREHTPGVIPKQGPLR